MIDSTGGRPGDLIRLRGMFEYEPSKDKKKPNNSPQSFRRNQVLQCTVKIPR